MKKIKVFLTLVVLLGCVALGAWLAMQFISQKPTAREVIMGPAVLKEIKQLNELITVRQVIQTVVAARQKRPPLGEERIVLIVRGNVEAGVKLDELTTADVEVDSERKSVTIKLPQPQILRLYIDDENTQVWERTKPIFVRYDEKLDQTTRQDALALIRKTAIELKILAQAQQFAELSVKGLLQTLGFENVNVGFREDVAVEPVAAGVR